MSMHRSGASRRDIAKPCPIGVLKNRLIENWIGNRDASASEQANEVHA
jgi:hypothetical protein